MLWLRIRSSLYKEEQKSAVNTSNATGYEEPAQPGNNRRPLYIHTVNKGKQPLCARIYLPVGGETVLSPAHAPDPVYFVCSSVIQQAVTSIKGE